MHPVIVESLEEYLSGNLLPSRLREFEAHLTTCQACREEVRGMQEVSSLMGVFRPAELIAPSPGFVARVMRQVGTEQPVVSFWSLFSLDTGFARRVVFASLMTLAVLGSYLVTRETSYTPAAPTPEAVMAIEQAPANAPQGNDRDMMLVTLTSYEP